MAKFTFQSMRILQLLAGWFLLRKSGGEVGFRALCLVGRRQEEALLDRLQKM